MESPPHCEPPASPRLGLGDAVSIILGIVMGAGIYETAPFILRNVSSPWLALGVWGLGGLLSLVGALCYAELATTYPRPGGDYVYLSRAFGPLVGFLFGWAQLTVVLTASIGAMAFVFADYAVRLWDLEPASAWPFLLAAAAVTTLTVLNLMGLVCGKGTQNLLTAAKVLGLGGILLAGFGWGGAAGWAAAEPTSASTNFGLAMILVLYTYGGWNDAAFVAAEVRDLRRNVPRALLLGTAGVTLIYVLVNAAYIWGLGFEGAGRSTAIAADVLHLPLKTLGAKAMCLLVMVSALASVNGMILTGSRVYASLGADHRAFARLGRWYPRLGVPVWALAAQALISLAMSAVVGTYLGQGSVNALMTGLGLRPVPWSGHGGFETLVTCSAPVFWAFFLLTGVSLFVLRWKDPAVERPFAVPLFPLLPLLFCSTCAFMLWSSVRYVVGADLLGSLLVLALGPLALGLPLFFVSRWTRPRS